MRKVLLIGPLLPSGGVTRYVKDLLSWSGKYQFILFNTARPAKNRIKAGLGYAEVFNAGLIRALQGVLITLSHMIAFPWRLVQSRADIVHICGVSYWPFWENAYYMLISRLLRRRVTLHYLGALDLYYMGRNRLEQALIRTVLRQPQKLILLSKKAYDLAATLLPVERLSVIPSSVDTMQFDQNNDKKATQDNLVRVLFMGGIDPFRKGVLDLLDAAAIVVRENPNVRFIMSGGDSFQEVEKQWKKLGLENHIEFVGWIPENQKARAYHSADILVLPSHNEGLPYVIIEALASGLPIIASSVGGIPEVVIHGENGYIIEPGDSHSLAKYILLLAANPELRQIISKHNRERARKYYSLSAAISQLERLFDEIIGEGK
jgi:glycosyltransferase involved in cell wall biosynthesis